MMGRQDRDQGQLFYEFSLEEVVPKDHLLRRMNVFVAGVLADVHQHLKPFYSDIGRPSVDPELMIRMLIVGYCHGIRHERRLCEEVKLHLAYRWFCKLALDDRVPHHSTFSINRLERFRESDILRHIFERVVAACMEHGLIKGEGFAIDASVMEANASRYHGKAPDELDWTDAQRQKRAVAEYLAALKAEARSQSEMDRRNDPGDGLGGESEPGSARKPPKVISPSDPSSAWTAKANKRVLFGYGLNYLIDVEHAIIVDVEATPARTYDEVAATRTMLERTRQRFGLSPRRLAADTADRQVPGLRYRGRHHPAHSRVGHEQTGRRHFLALRVQVRSQAKRLHLSRRRDADNEWPGQQRPRDPLLRICAALPRVSAETEMLPKHALTSDCA